MTFAKLGRLVLQSIRRNTGDFALSSIGIIVGISTLLLFTALGSGVNSVVLEEIFSVRQLEVVEKSYSVGAVQTGSLFGDRGLTDKTVERLRDIEGVEAAYPKMKLTFPASIRGGEELVGRDMIAELIGDGIPPRLVEGELEGDVAFRDWEDISCEADADCPGGYACADGTCRGESCRGGNAASVCEAESYCDTRADRCRMPIPVIISPKLLEVYNSSLHTALGGAEGPASQLPQLSDEALIGFEIEGIFGTSYLGRSQQGDPLRRRLRLVGFSERAVDMGVTMPMGYVRRLNARFSEEETAGNYHSIVVETTSNDVVASVAKTITDEMNLALTDRYEQAQRAGLLIMILTLVFNAIGLIILAISAINIMHTFLMILLERRREIGLMRAIGAEKGNIRLLVFGESALIGLLGGLAGVIVGWGAISLVDWLFATQVADFPFKPETLFNLEWWMILAALGVAIVFCILGALLPAIRASQIDPAEALTK